jgi:hypothetical membrane protein
LNESAKVPGGRGTAAGSAREADVPGGRRALLLRRFAVVGVIASVGFLLAVTNASSPDWYWLNASSLGIDPGARVYFNLTMALLGVTFIGVARPMRRQLLDLRERGLVSARWASAYRLGLAAIPVGLVGVGIFHIGGAKLPWLLHDIAGFLIPLVVMAMMLTLHWAIPAVRPRFELRSLIVLAAIVGLFVLAVLEAISYSLMEIVAFVICWAWLLRYAIRVEDLLARDVARAPVRLVSPA